MENLNQGLLISLYGIGITFLMLAVVILLIKLILFLFPAKQIRPAVSPSQTEDSDPNLPHVVAFAAAWWLANQKDPTLGKNLENPPGSWWRQADK